MKLSTYLIVCIAVGQFLCTASGSDHFDIIDGTIHLRGTFERLAGIEALSAGGHLSFNQMELGPNVTVPDISPFAFGTASILSETPNALTYGVRSDKCDRYRGGNSNRYEL